MQRKEADLLLVLEKSVCSIARRYCNATSAEFDDLLQVGRIGALEALRDYKPAFNTKLITFAVPHIVGAIRHYMRDLHYPIRTPGWVQEENSRARQKDGSEDWNRIAVVSFDDIGEDGLDMLNDSTDCHSAWLADPHDFLDRLAQRSFLDDILRSLSAKERRLLMLVYGEEYTIPEAALRLGYTASGGQNRIKRATLKARKDMALRGTDFLAACMEQS